MSTDFVQLTELAGDDVAVEQVERLARRYYWAAPFCVNKDVVEVACGTGQGVGYLASKARSMAAGDFCKALLDIARRHYRDRLELKEFDAQSMPFANGAFDVVVLFEAIYYLPDTERFFAECRRVMRPGGTLLIATANKDLFDFNPSPHSFSYSGVVELELALKRHGFSAKFWGDTPIESVSARQRVLRPIKALASRLGLIPKSMAGKKLLKRLVFGGLVKMPPEVTDHTAPQVAPTPLPNGQPDTSHKVIYCAAVLDA